MRRSTTTAGLATALALMAAPAFALPPQVPVNQGTQRAAQNPGAQSAGASEQGTSHRPATPGPDPSAQAKARAYGKACSDQSKKHVDGEKGTAFSRCVTAMAKLASGQTRSPREACKTESKKHVAGEKGTSFSRCVSAGAKLLRHQANG